MIRALVVDDSALARKLFTQILASDDAFSVAVARNGADALDMLGAQKFDVVTLDINMPHMDGLTCLDRIMIERPCPVVMVSSRDPLGVDITLDALRRGAVDFIEKPDGPLSLALADFAPELLTKVRSAAGSRLPPSLRLRERVKSRIGGALAPRLRTTRRPGAASGDGVRLVLVGCSTGGPSALETLLCAIPSDFPAPIVVAQHLPSSFTATLAERLNERCALQVLEVSAATRLAAGGAYIARGGADMITEWRGDAIWALPAESDPSYLWRPSVNRMVESAMTQFAASGLVGVLMTGMGNDGAAAMAALRAAGGATIAEAESTAVVWGMPGELAKLGGAQAVLPLQDIAARLIRIARNADHSQSD